MPARHRISRHPTSGHYYARIMRGGKSLYFNLGFDLRQADARLRQVEKDIAAGLVKFGGQITTLTTTQSGTKDIRIEELAHRYLDHVKANRAPGTYRNKLISIGHFLKFVGPCMVSAITRMKLEEYYIWAKLHHGRTANAGNTPLSQVKSMLRWADEVELCNLAFKRFPRMTHTPPETARFTEEEIGKLLAAAHPDFRDLLEFALLTGLRPPELRGLRQCHILRENSVPVSVFIETHKTAKSTRDPKPRSVPLCARTRAIVERQVASHPKNEFIFLNDDGTPYKRYTLRNRLWRLCKRIGVRKIAPYGLRHSFASLASENHAETTGLAAVMGHSTSRTLMRYVKNSFAGHLDTINGVESRVAGIVAAATTSAAAEGQDIPKELPKLRRARRRPGFDQEPAAVAANPVASASSV